MALSCGSRTDTAAGSRSSTPGPASYWRRLSLGPIPTASATGPSRGATAWATTATCGDFGGHRVSHRWNLWSVLLLGLVLSACRATAAPSTLTSPSLESTASPTPSLVPTVSPSASPSGPPRGGVYAATVSGLIDPSLAGIPERVYVPNEVSGDVVVIDPATFQIVSRFPVGAYPEHITPDWDLSKLYVNNMNSSSLTIIDPRTSRPTGTINVPNPYNLYFSMDGSKAIAVDDFLGTATVQNNGLYFYDRRTWKLLKFLQIPYPGVDHL